MKTKTDIEKLLRWAIREELPKGRAVSTDAYGLISNFSRLALGTHVDVSHRGDTFGRVPGEPHRDALAVAEALRALPQDFRTSGETALAELIGDYAAIDDDGAAQSALDAPRNLIALVLHAAIMGRAPEWDVGVPCPRQVFEIWRDVNGHLQKRPLVVGTDSAGVDVQLLPRRGRIAQRYSAYDLSFRPRSQIRWRDPGAGQVAEARAEYAAWHAGLRMMYAALSQADLQLFVAVPPRAPQAPWNGGAAGAGADRVLADLRPSATAPEAGRLVPARRSAGTIRAVRERRAVSRR